MQPTAIKQTMIAEQIFFYENNLKIVNCFVILVFLKRLLFNGNLAYKICDKQRKEFKQKKS